MAKKKNTTIPAPPEDLELKAQLFPMVQACTNNLGEYTRLVKGLEKFAGDYIGKEADFVQDELTDVICEIDLTNPKVKEETVDRIHNLLTKRKQALTPQQ